MNQKIKNDIMIVGALLLTIAFTALGAIALGVWGFLGCLLFIITALVVIRDNKVVTVENHLLPFPSLGCINLFGYLLCRNRQDITDRTYNHEAIHTAQMRELLYVGFYLWYVIEWMWQGTVWLFNKDMRPYLFITFEQEAYEHDNNLSYLRTRKRWNWVSYIGKWKAY